MSTFKNNYDYIYIRVQIKLDVRITTHTFFKPLIFKICNGFSITIIIIIIIVI